MDRLEAFVDGSCNPFDKEDTYGSYAYCILEQDNIIEEGAEFVHNTTNNRMELSAILMVLSKVTDVVIYSDSQYCVKGFNEWMHSWKRSNWKNGKVKNIDLWEQMYEYKDSLCKIQWVKGHSKKEDRYSKWNNYVDDLCTKIVNKNGKQSFEQLRMKKPS